MGPARRIQARNGSVAGGCRRISRPILDILPGFGILRYGGAGGSCSRIRDRTSHSSSSSSSSSYSRMAWRREDEDEDEEEGLQTRTPEHRPFPYARGIQRREFGVWTTGR